MTTPDAAALLAAWDEQQAAYIASREARFDAMLDAIALTAGEAFVAVDLACGPGSLAARILDRFPAARVIGLDCDPVLLRLAQLALGDADGRLRLVDADLLDPDWPLALAGERPDVLVSTTALHWLAPDELVRVYAAAAGTLGPGGLLLNGDHQRLDSRTPFLRQLAADHDARTQRDGWAAGAPTWDAWWADAIALPQLGALAAERERRFADRPAPPPTPVDFHLTALRQAGFSEAGTIWQLFDDYVVLGRR